MIKQLSDEDYHALDRLSYSKHKSLLKSVRQFKYDQQNPFTGNDSTRVGTVVHMWLEGEHSKIVFEPDLSQMKTKAGAIAKVPRSTSEGKALLQACQEKLPPGHILIPYDYKEMLDDIKVQFDENPSLQEKLSRVQGIEIPYLFEAYGVEWKGRTDLDGDDFIMDFKRTAKGIGKYSFKKTIEIMNYDLQAAVYLTGKAQKLGICVHDLKYHFVAIESQAPYDIALYTLSYEQTLTGLDKMQIVANRYKKHILNREPFHREFESI